jgi:phosphate uptake regulator
METRKIQRSGTTYYLYLPASWCREHKITTDSTVFLDKSSKGDLLVQPKKSESSLSSLKLELTDNNPEVINKMIIASYINPVKEFEIKLKNNISPDQILAHKSLLGGMEIVDFDESSISCQTSLALSDPNILIESMIKKILSVTNLMKKDPSHELITRYEEEIDKSNLLIQKSIITTLMYRRESKLRHIDLFYIGNMSKLLERISDILITLGKDPQLVETVDEMLKLLLKVLENLTQPNVVQFVKSVDKLAKIEVKDLPTYKKSRIYSGLGHIAEILCDWVVTDIVDKSD